MKLLGFLQVAILALLGMVSANSLVFFTAGDNCWPTTDHVGCYDTGERQCCRSADPFCVTGALMDSDGITHTTYLLNATYCEVYDDPKNYDRCITSDICCLYLPLERNTNKCSAFWHYGEPDPDPNNPSPPGSMQTKKDEPCREPNFLVYHDGDTPRKMLIPDGEFEQVMEMYYRRDFTALGRYETFGG